MRQPLGRNFCFDLTFQAVYNGTKALINSFAAALANEFKDTGVAVTCLMPGATETRFLSVLTIRK